MCKGSGLWWSCEVVSSHVRLLSVNVTGFSNKLLACTDVCEVQLTLRQQETVTGLCYPYSSGSDVIILVTYL